MRRKSPMYIYRKGGITLAVGRSDELAEQLGVLPKTIHFYRTPSYKLRSAKYRPENVIDVLRADECECELCERDAVRFGMDDAGDDVPMCEVCYENECGWGNTG